jgi:hypothetical protein
MLLNLEPQVSLAVEEQQSGIAVHQLGAVLHIACSNNRSGVLKSPRYLGTANSRP